MPEILQYAFMQRAFLSGMMVALLLGWLGVYVTSRKMSYIGDGIAHASLAGIAIGLLAGFAPIPISALYAILVAIGLYTLEHKVRISSDAAIGILLTSSMALGVVLLQFFEGYQPELMSYLFGSMLAIGTVDMVSILIIGALLLAALSFVHKKFSLSMIDPVGAYLSGLRPDNYLLFLYIAVAIAVVMSIQLVGIILVSALLILPSATARLSTKTYDSFWKQSILYALLYVILGLIISFYADLPSGATIILTGSAIFGLSALWSVFKK